jgi:hypothetical protein
MHTSQSQLVSRARWITWAKIGLALSLALLIPALRLPQPVTGPLVNALLILTALSAGPQAAVAVGLVTPLNALFSGVLPLPMMVLIPFIALGNGLYAVVFSALRERSFWLGIAAGAAVKFALLYAASTWLVTLLTGLLFGKALALPAAAVYTMQWPQLATALAGGVLAYAILTSYKRLAR